MSPALTEEDVALVHSLADIRQKVDAAHLALNLFIAFHGYAWNRVAPDSVEGE